jgi:hypothetical protein
MNRLAYAVVAALLVLPAIGAHAAGKAAPVTGKLRAPVTVEASISGGSAHVTVRFDRAATGVRVQVRGLDGLAVTSEPAPVKGGRFAAGEVATFDVAFTPGPGRSFLSVGVQGSFGAGRRATSVSFPVGEKSAEQRKPAGTVVEGANGERIKALPSGN